MQDYINYTGDLSKLSKRELKDLFTSLEDYKLSAKPRLNIPAKESFGIEVEFVGVALKEVKDKIERIRDFKYWSVHEEKSVHDIIDGEIIGGEISTDILHDTERDWQKLFKLYHKLKSLGAKSTNRTALHIHVGAQILEDDIKYLKRFIKVWCIFEDVIFRFGYNETSTPRSIENINIFAIPLAPNYKKVVTKHPHYFEDACVPKEFDFGKRNAVAFHNYHYPTSEEEINNDIEIRCPNGTLNPLIVQNNVNFFLKLMLYVTSPRYDEKLINRLFKKIGTKTLEEYSILDFKKSCLLGDLIFESGQDKIDFLRGVVKNSDYIVR